MCISIIMRASYDSIDNKQKMCEKVNKDITFIQFFHSTRLHSTELFKIFFSLLNLKLLFCKKLVGREKVVNHFRYFRLKFELLMITVQIRSKLLICHNNFIKYPGKVSTKSKFLCSYLYKGMVV